MRKFPPADIFTAQTLRTADPQPSAVSAPSERAGQLRKLPRTQALLRTHTHLGPGSGRFTLKRVSCHAQGGGPTRHSVGPPPWGGAPRPARARAAPRSSPLFAPRPRSTWVSLRTARQVVKPNVEELRARPAHKDHRSGAGARDAGRPDPQLWCARTHTQAPAHRDACGRLTRNLRSCPTLRLPPRPVFPFNTVSDS
jgi:hypothetical protein